MDKYFLAGKKQDYYVHHVMDEMKKMVPTVYRDLSGGEDGEAVIGCNCMGDVAFHVTFDSMECAKMDEHIQNGTLREYIYRQSGHLDE